MIHETKFTGLKYEDLQFTKLLMIKSLGTEFNFIYDFGKDADGNSDHFSSAYNFDWKIFEKKMLSKNSNQLHKRFLFR